MVMSNKKMLNNQFDMKDIGLADDILGIKITKTSEGYSLSQTHYIEKILDKFGKYNKCLARTPVDASLYLPKNKEKVYHS